MPARTCSTVWLEKKDEVRSFIPMSKVYSPLEKAPSSGSRRRNTEPAERGRTVREEDDGRRRIEESVRRTRAPCWRARWDLALNWENCHDCTSREKGLNPFWKRVAFCRRIEEPAVAKLAPWLKFDPTESR